MATRDLVKTGIRGLDELFFGGILKDNVILTEGAPGTGKTLMGTEFIYRGVTEYKEPGIIVVFEVSPEKLIRDAAGFGWDLEELQRQRKLQVIFTSPQTLSQELRSPDSLLLETAAELDAQRIFIDSISLLRGAAPLSTGMEEEAAYRELLQRLIEGLQRENLTTILAHELVEPDAQPDALQFLVDTAIILRREPNLRGVHRTLEILKSRGQGHEAGKHSLRITAERGLEVFRRVQAKPRGKEAQPTSTTRRSVIGAPALDELIGGGIFEGSTTMVIGASGIGKTMLGVQLLLEGAQTLGQRGLLVSLDEHPAQILRNAEGLGLDLKEQLDSDMIHVLYEFPQELDVDAHFDQILRTIEAQKIQRLVIDGMTSYSAALEDQRAYRNFFHALVGYSKHRLITTFFNYENPELFGVTQFMPDFPVSSIVDNIIVLSYVELGNTLRRAITIAKARGSRHQFVTREFEIKEGGISLLPLDQSKIQAALPFPSYQGLISRAPTRRGSRLDGTEDVP